MQRFTLSQLRFRPPEPVATQSNAPGPGDVKKRYKLEVQSGISASLSNVPTMKLEVDSAGEIFEFKINDKPCNNAKLWLWDTERLFNSSGRLKTHFVSRSPKPETQYNNTIPRPTDLSYIFRIYDLERRTTLFYVRLMERHGRGKALYADKDFYDAYRERGATSPGVYKTPLEGPIRCALPLLLLESDNYAVSIVTAAEGDVNFGAKGMKFVAGSWCFMKEMYSLAKGYIDLTYRMGIEHVDYAPRNLKLNRFIRTIIVYDYDRVRPVAFAHEFEDSGNRTISFSELTIEDYIFKVPMEHGYPSLLRELRERDVLAHGMLNGLVDSDVESYRAHIGPVNITELGPFTWKHLCLDIIRYKSYGQYGVNVCFFYLSTNIVLRENERKNSISYRVSCLCLWLIAMTLELSRTTTSNLNNADKIKYEQTWDIIIQVVPLELLQFQEKLGINVDASGLYFSIFLQLFNNNWSWGKDDTDTAATLTGNELSQDSRNLSLKVTYYDEENGHKESFDSNFEISGVRVARENETTTIKNPTAYFMARIDDKLF